MQISTHEWLTVSAWRSLRLTKTLLALRGRMSCSINPCRFDKSHVITYIKSVIKYQCIVIGGWCLVLVLETTFIHGTAITEILAVYKTYHQDLTS